MRMPNVTVNPGDVEKGAKIFKTKCAQCHNADKVRGCRRGRSGGAALIPGPVWVLEAAMRLVPAARRAGGGGQRACGARGRRKVLTG